MVRKETGSRDATGNGGTLSGEKDHQESAREISGTVAALRLDAVMALGFNLSRSRAVLLIKGGLVEVNGRSVDAPACRLKQGDRISVQKRGRLELAALAGESRKGRQRIKLYKFT